MKKYFLSIIFSFLVLFSNANDRLGFGVKINEIPFEFKTASVQVMPGDTILLEFTGTSTDQFMGKHKVGILLEDTRLKWRYIVPDLSGNYEFIVLHNNPPEKFTLNVFVYTPASQQKGDYLNGYKIGKYPKKPFRENPKYLPPKGFIEVTESNQDIYVSPHFQLKQFLCKQQPDHWPKYVLLDPLLLAKLELLIEGLNKEGLKADHLFIMSGYRTPYYNATIKNGKYSRHQYGDAVDVYVDENLDGVIDDLNKDGKASMSDADVIYNVVEAIEKNPKYKYFVGGMGKYKKTATHTWDVHVDTRGYRARW